jgi:hypothetical protein
MTDQEYKRDLDEAVHQLNTAILAATQAGLTVDVQHTTERFMGLPQEAQQFHADVMRVQHVTNPK